MSSDVLVGNPHGSSTASIDSELNEVAGHLNAQHARLVDIAVRLMADESRWQGTGVWTVEQYLAWRTGVSSARARHIADIARRAHELPTCMASFAQGELSMDQVSAVAPGMSIVSKRGSAGVRHSRDDPHRPPRTGMTTSRHDVTVRVPIDHVDSASRRSTRLAIPT